VSARLMVVADGDAELGELAVDARRFHRGFAMAIALTSATTSVLTGGRPPRDRPERRVQYSRKRRRCQRRTVSGDTMTSACRQPVQTLARPTQNRRSAARSFGRGVSRL
jgi:hypothetical protein